MSLWYEIIRVLGITVESKEIERLLSGDADPEERKAARLKLKTFIENGPPRELDFKQHDEYEAAYAAYNKIKGYYDKLTNRQ